MNDLKYKHINISNSLLKQNFIWHYVKNQIQLYMYDSLTHFILGYWDTKLLPSILKKVNYSLHFSRKYSFICKQGGAKISFHLILILTAACLNLYEKY